MIVFFMRLFGYCPPHVIDDLKGERIMYTAPKAELIKLALAVSTSGDNGGFVPPPAPNPSEAAFCD